MTRTDGSRCIGWKIEGEGIARSQIVLVLEFMRQIEDEDENDDEDDLVPYPFSFAPLVPFCGDSTSDSRSSFLLCFDSPRVKLGSC